MSVSTKHKLLPQVESFLSQSPLASVVGGEHFPNAQVHLIATIDPDQARRSRTFTI